MSDTRQGASPHPAWEDRAELVEHYASIDRTGGIVSRCKMWLPPLLEGLDVVDLECRRGKGVYAISQRIGARGHVIGTDSDESRIEDARAHAPQALRKSGLGMSNMDFLCAPLEDLGVIDDASTDLVIIKSVLNLAFDIPEALAEMYRILRPGGELYHASLTIEHPHDAAARSRAPAAGDAFGCASTLDDLSAMMVEAGFTPPLSQGRIETLPEPGAYHEAQDRFLSCVLRSFKLPKADEADDEGASSADDAPVMIAYRGTIPECPTAFALDDSLSLRARVPVEVPAWIARALASSRYAPYLEVIA